MKHDFFRSPGFGLAAWLLGLGALPLAAAPARAQMTFASLYDFTAQNGATPYAGLIQGSDGNFYGTTFYGGAENTGTAFKMTPVGVITTLVSFTGTNGEYPYAGLIQATDGSFYGVTQQGGASGSGTVFKITSAGAFSTLYDFSAGSAASPPTNSDGIGPTSLIQGSDGSFYGTAGGGGTMGYGTVFKITLSGTLTTLHDFTFTDGYNPDASLVQGSDGNFYGTTYGGGPDSGGTVFKITPGGTLSTLYAFPISTNGQYENGESPRSALVQGPDGDFYGTTSWSGFNGPGSGTAFKITPSGTLTTLVNFTGSNGANPRGGLILGADGNYYGTTGAGGTTSNDVNGTIFKMTAAGALTTICNFPTDPFKGDLNGSSPWGSLVQGTDGNFYGVTAAGGTGGSKYGTIFNVSPAGALTTLVDFTYASGAYPETALVQGSDGDFYGTTLYGGSTGYGDTFSGDGTVFKTTSNGVVTTLCNFTGLNGAYPKSALVEGRDGDFYGTTEGGGSQPNGPGFTGYGTVFKITPSGTLTTLYDFAPDDSGNTLDGAYPLGALVQDSDGDFYGVTDGGVNGFGTVYKITPSGTLTTLHVFSAEAGGTNGTNSDGATPLDGLVLGTDGNFYGTASAGGINASGTVFKITPSGTFTTLYSFTAPDANGDNPNGASPQSALVQGSDGSFYGTTYGGGTGGKGTIFKITSSGALTTLYDFTGLTDGGGPNTALVADSDGNFYGTTSLGTMGASGTPDSGTVFKITPLGTLTTLHEFVGGLLGGDSVAALVEGSDGNLYGAINNGMDASVQSDQQGVDAGFLFGLFGPPTAYGASASAGENTPMPFTVAFDDPSGKGVTSIAFPERPRHGTVTGGEITEIGTAGTVALTYTPAANYTGTDSFTYTVTGYVGTSTPQAVNLSVHPATAPPTITSFSPTSGPVGTTVVITGTSLTGATVVGFTGAHAAFTISAATQITAIVPSGAITGPIAVATPGGNARSTASFTVTVPPTITAFTPTAGPVGTIVTVTGMNFTGATAVKFNGASAAFTVTSATSITATVSAETTTGPLSVTTPAGTATSEAAFTVTASAPTITSISPPRATTGTVITITGTNLTGTTSITVGGMSVPFTIVNSTTITFIIPAGSVGGTIVVTTPGGTASGTVTLVVLTWTAGAVGTGPGGTARILWNRSDEAAGLWVLGVNDAYTAIGPIYGPYPGWSATAIATAGDGTSRMLWVNTNGSASLWTLNAAGVETTEGPTYAPPGAGWTAKAVGVASDGTSRVLWTSAGGAMRVWSFGVNDAQTLTGPAYGPISGWSAKSLSTAPDGTSRVLWVRADGAAGVWSLGVSDAQSVVGSVYGPFSGWTATAVGAAGDGTSRVLWTNVNGDAGVWSFGANDVAATVGATYGPYPGWAAGSLATANDGTSRVLWDRSDRSAGVWTLGVNDVQSVVGTTYGPY